MRSLTAAWPALGARNFRLFLGGQALSLAGTFMQQVAMGWLVYRLTQSAFALGAVTFVTEMAGVAVALFGGLLADRMEPRRILVVTQSLALLQALALAALVVTDRVDLAAIVVLSALLGAVNGVDLPARQVFVLQLVERPEHVRSAIALSSVALDSARLVGPSLGGVLVARVGEWLCFLLNAASYVPLVAALVAMKVAARPRTPAAESVRESLAAGLRSVAGTRAVRRILLLVALVGFAGGPYAVLMPVMAADVLGGGPHTLGILTASIGVGALAGAVFLGLRGQDGRYERVIALGAGLFGASLLLFARSPWLVLSVPLLVVAGFGVMLLMASSHTALLVLADEDKRGRVMSLFTLSFMTTVPIGALCAGTAASVAGAPAVIATGGALCTLAAFVFLATRVREA